MGELEVLVFQKSEASKALSSSKFDCNAYVCMRCFKYQSIVSFYNLGMRKFFADFLFLKLQPSSLFFFEAKFISNVVKNSTCCTGKAMYSDSIEALLLTYNNMQVSQQTPL